MSSSSEDDLSDVSSYYALPTSDAPPPTASERKEVKALESNPVKMKLTQDILLQKEQIDILKNIYKTIRRFQKQMDTNNSMILPTLTAIKNCNCKKEKKHNPPSMPEELKAAMYSGGYKRRKTRRKRRRKTRRKRTRKTRRKRKYKPKRKN